MRAWARFSRSFCCSRKISATTRVTRTACSGSTKAFRRTARCGSLESPPPTRSE